MWKNARFLSLLLMAGCAGMFSWPQFSGDGFVTQNIQRSDYAGSQACARCHNSIYQDFMQSPMHHMTRLPENARVLAPFDGHVFRFKEDSVVLETRDGQRWMRIQSPRFGNHVFRVTKVIGGHHREDFAGVEENAVHPHEERVLPVSYMLTTGKFRYKGYSVMDPERPGLKPGAVWNQTCIFCHNTVPYLSTMLQVFGQGHGPYQGETVDPLLPPDRRWSWTITDSNGLRRALRDEIHYLKDAAISKPDNKPYSKPDSTPDSLPKLAGAAIDATRKHFDETRVLEIGIGCESCHGGSRQHVRSPWIFKPSLEPRSSFVKTEPPTALGTPARHAQDVTRMCARCHQVLFSRYPWTWEGAARNGSAPGGAHINSGEGRDLLLSRCQITCTDCHDPHAHDDRARLAQLEGPAANAICLRCHAPLAAPAALRAHAHHAPEGPGGLCLNCHMPEKNMSLDSRLSRYHRIGSPNDPIKVEGDRPLECALCHGDKTVASLIDTMEHWWPSHRYNRAALRALYGDSNTRVLEATLRNGKPHEQAVALYLAGQRRDTSLVPWVVRQLTNPYPLVRFYADNALAQMRGAPSPLDLNQVNDSINAAAALWLRSASWAKPEAGSKPSLDTNTNTED